MHKLGQPCISSPHDGPLCRSFWGDPRAFRHQHVLMLSVRISRVIKPTQAEPATLDIEQDRAKTRELRGVPRTPIAQQLALVGRLHGIERRRMLREMAELATGPGFLMPSEYFIYRLFEPAMPMPEKRRFIGKRIQGLMHGACTDRRWQAIADVKLVF